LKEELDHPAHAVSKVADGLPAMGIVAAVLGIVITMSILAEADNAMIGYKVGSALVGTFLGILASYGFFGPLA
ncbi:MAG TPA: flagellar motor stator protein MotA, partial [Pseudomonas sp.]|nr:flagellar motor stator protein MotA [Pseudomonas sp.]